MRALATLLLVSACALAQESAPIADWRFAHPSPTLVGGMRLKVLLDSPTVNEILAESAAKDPNVALGAAMLKNALGGVTDIRFSLLQTGKDAKGQDQVDALLLVTGKLDEQLVTALTQGQATARRIDENTVLLGKAASLDEAVARMAEPPALLKNRALMRGSSLTANDLWVAGTLPDSPMTGALKVNLRGLAFGLTLSADLSMDLSMEAATAEMAQTLVEEARKAEASQAKLDAKLEATVEDTTAHFRVTIPADKVAELARQGMAAQAASTAPSASKADPPVPPPPPRRKSIVIQGLDGGTREIPMSQGR